MKDSLKVGRSRGVLMRVALMEIEVRENEKARLKEGRMRGVIPMALKTEENPRYRLLQNR